MRIFRFIYLIFSIIAACVFTALSITYRFDTFSFFIILLLLFLPNYLLRNNDRKQAARIIYDYSNNCDPYLYINSMEKYRKGCLLSKKQKMVYDLYKCVALLDAGEFDRARDILIDIDKAQVGFDDVTNMILIKNWCEYFYYNNLDVKLKASILKMKELITSSSDNNLRAGSGLVYHNLEAKYYILSGENLMKARKIYTDVANMAPTKLNVVRAMYELALIDIKEKRYDDALVKLKRVSEHNNSLYIVRRSKEIIDMYNNK